jgi:hypothetical protein
LSFLDPDTAAAMLAGVERHDPRGILTRADLRAMCDNTACIAATVDGGGQAVLLVAVRHRQAWIEAAKGHGGADLVRDVLPAVELAAMPACDSVAFRTARRGLVRKAMKQGYQVTGWVMRKALK